MATKARIAVIGTGWWATATHLPVLSEHPDAKLVAICDTDREKLALVRDTFGHCPGYDSHEALLENEDLDAVVIATSHKHHYPIARDALNRGLHVLIEKPMTTCASEARELVQLAKNKSREIIVGYPCSYSANAQAIRKVIQAGDIGRVQLVISQYCSNIMGLLRGDDFVYSNRGVVRPSKAYSQKEQSGGGHGQSQLTHAIGLVFLLLDIHAVKVAGFMKNHSLSVDLVDALTVEFENEVIGNFAGIGNASTNKYHYLQLYGERGWIEMSLIAKEAAVYRYDQLNKAPQRFTDQKIWPKDGAVRNLVDVVLGRAANGSPGDIGWRAVEVLDAAYRSNQQGGSSVTVQSLYESQE